MAANYDFTVDVSDRDRNRVDVELCGRLVIMETNVCTVKLLFHQSPMRHSDYTYNDHHIDCTVTVDKCQRHDAFTLDQLFSHCAISINHVDYFITALSLLSHPHEPGRWQMESGFCCVQNEVFDIKISPSVCAMSYYLWACIHSTNIFLIIFKLSVSTFLNLILNNIVWIDGFKCIFYVTVSNTFVFFKYDLIPILSKSILLLYKSFHLILVYVIASS